MSLRSTASAIYLFIFNQSDKYFILQQSHLTTGFLNLRDGSKVSVASPAMQLQLNYSTAKAKAS